MSLDGLRAWIGEVERKLGMRTRVFLVLTTIAIGGAGAGIYLALDARDNAVSEGDVQELQEQLEAQIGTGGTAAGVDVVRLEAELKTLQAQVAQLESKGSASSQGDGASGTDGASQSGKTKESAGANAGSDGATPDFEELQELAEQVKEQAEAAK